MKHYLVKVAYLVKGVIETLLGEGVRCGRH